MLYSEGDIEIVRDKQWTLSLSVYRTLTPVISRPKSEGRFQAPTRFAVQFQSFDPLVGDWDLPANRVGDWNFLLYELSFQLST